MFPEVGATELMVVAAVALIVVGPKDLPVLLRKIGQAMARMRGMASEFRASFDEMARQSELEDLRREVEAMRTGQYLDPAGAAASAHSAEVNDIFYEIEHDIAAIEPDGALSADPDPVPVRAPKPRARKAAADKVPAKPRPRRPRAAPEPDS